jgi:hypothetical protein
MSRRWQPLAGLRIVSCLLQATLQATCLEKNLNDRPVCHFLRCALYAVALFAFPLVRASTHFDVDTVADLVDDNVNDDLCHTSANTCSLRAAIMQANHASNADGTDIQLQAQTYVLTRAPSGADGEDNGDLNVTRPLDASLGHFIVVHGFGPGFTIIDGNGSDRVFNLAHDSALAIHDLTIRNGARQDPPSHGGGILSQGGPLSIFATTIEGNHAVAGGGGISSAGPLSLYSSTVRSNSAGSGGGLEVVAGQALVVYCTLNDNGAFNGGGIANGAGSGNGVVYATNDTISGNYALNNGGGIYSTHTTGAYNVTIVGNDADHDRDEAGGIGGGVYAQAGTGFIVVNSLIAGNTILDNPIPDNCNGALEAYGLTLLDDPSGCTTTTSNANLGFVSLSTIGQLQDNGGPTWTHALLAGSQAIDGTRASQSCVDENGTELTIDQRLLPRPVGARCDVGAFEYGATPPLDDLIFKNGFN